MSEDIIRDFSEEKRTDIIQIKHDEFEAMRTEN